MKNFDEIQKDIQKSLIKDTIVRIFFDDKSQKIREMEFLHIVRTTEKGLRLNNGVLVCKESLFPYHHKKNYHHGEEYFLLESLKF